MKTWEKLKHTGNRIMIKHMKRLGVDADEVLWGCLECFLEYYNPRYKTNATLDDFHTYNWERALGCNRIQLYKRYMDFHTRGGGYQMKPFPDAYKTLKRVRELSLSTPVVITARNRVLEKETRELLDMHFPGVFDDIYFGNHLSRSKINKSLLCQRAGVDVLIEDNLRYALDCAQTGITVLLYGGYRWNQTDEPLPGNIIPVANWQEVAIKLGLNKEVYGQST